MPTLASTIGGELYPAKVLRDGAVGYWRLGDLSGLTAVDSAQTPHNATYTADVALVQAGALADGNAAADFPGLTGQAVVTGYTLTLIPQVSFEAWIWADTIHAVQLRVWFAGRNTSYISLAAGGAFPARVIFSLDMNGGVQNTVAGTLIIPVGTWTHVVGTFDATDTKMRIYINGVLNATSASFTVGTGLRISTGTFRIGAYDNLTPANFWDGKLDEVALYATCLTPRQIAEHYALRLAVLSGLSASGAAAVRKGTSVIASGGMRLGGAAVLRKSTSRIGSGGLRVGGAGIMLGLSMPRDTDVVMQVGADDVVFQPAADDVVMQVRP